MLDSIKQDAGHIMLLFVGYFERQKRKKEKKKKRKKEKKKRKICEIIE